MSHLLHERRRRERILLRCPVEIIVSGEVAPRRAVTQNMSSNGIYCLSSIPFSPGERLPCQIEITPPSYAHATDCVSLDCVLEVIRVERRGDVYGVGCRIVRYVLRRGSGEAESSKIGMAAGAARV